MLLLLQILLPYVNVANAFSCVPFNVAYVHIATVVVYVNVDLDVVTLRW